MKCVKSDGPGTFLSGTFQAGKNLVEQSQERGIRDTWYTSVPIPSVGYGVPSRHLSGLGREDLIVLLYNETGWRRTEMLTQGDDQ